ncbi:energy-coupling factor ABC transporter ATP-binding protein [Bacillus suaedaesalsae]|uniref:Energy-coupling factor transporter ATP-binding protein EcfA2 n=1 Tax=Bacillus suaedaesalsae TaxID=2810349 RepID=A0ABS2DCK2_9BACI|nr:energy-coupling factor ABC transporter ATP-binding protein [Bacillus suaedaesalsae]MBM6616167.1 energy-coupling factor ABC transporter ATP-binding protein [Bacillus suaedaesalsae]
MEIKVEKLTHIYQEKSPFERLALHEIDLEIEKGSFVAFIGHTGSGKSTIIQHLNALLKPSEGKVTVGDYTITATGKEKQLKPLRKKVGMVFQFPEHQLFEETVEKDICFGPMNFGISEDVAKQRAKESLLLVGLPEELLQRSPFELSGGQMRRVAIAGVLAMEPDIIILDEPTAGLDPRGRKEIMNMFASLHEDKKLTTILVTHSMEDAASYADQIVVMEQGKILLKGTPDNIFSQGDILQSVGLDVPETYRFKEKLELISGKKIEGSFLTVEDMVDSIFQFLEKEGKV